MLTNLKVADRGNEGFLSLNKVTVLVYFLVFEFMLAMISASATYLHTFSCAFFFIALVINWVCGVRLSKKCIGYLILVELFLLVQSYIASGLAYKPVLSSAVLIYCAAMFFALGFFFKNKLDSSAKRAIGWALFGVVVVAVVAFLLERLGLYDSLFNNNKSCFPFAEPSWFALFVGPLCLFSIVFVSVVYRVLIVGAIFSLCILFPNITTGMYAVVGTLVIVLSSSLTRRGVVLGLAIMSLLIVAAGEMGFPNYFYQRAGWIGNNKSNFLAAFDYLDNWESVFYIFNNNPIGVGFQNLGSQPVNKYTLAHYEMGIFNMDRKNGGFLFSKIFSEFGFLTAPIFVWIFVVLRNKYKSARNINDRDAKAVLYTYIGLLVPLFIRDVGYFSYTLFWFFFATGYLYATATQSTEAIVASSRFS